MLRAKMSMADNEKRNSVNPSTTAAWPSCQATAAINPREATLTPSSKPWAQVERRNRRYERLADQDENKGGKENRRRRQNGTGGGRQRDSR